MLMTWATDIWSHGLTPFSLRFALHPLKSAISPIKIHKENELTYLLSLLSLNEDISICRKL